MNKFSVGIVGGAGYIGMHLARHLSETFAVRIVDKEPIQREFEGNVEYKQCDILKYEEIKQGLKDLDLVIHNAIIQIPTINEHRRLGYQVNLLGTQNVCKIVDENPSIKGMILSGSWHVFGEKELNGTIDEEFGFRPDKVESRARLYTLAKVAQEIIMRFYDEMSNKIYGVIRLGTVLGEGMHEKTAANIFISEGLRGEPITPYKHSMHRAMFYVDINDVCKAYKAYATKILNGEIHKEANSIAHVVNLCWPKPITIIELSHMIREAIIRLTEGKVKPEIRIVDTGESVPYDVDDKEKIRVDLNKLKRFLNLRELTNPQTSIERIVVSKMHHSNEE